MGLRGKRESEKNEGEWEGRASRTEREELEWEERASGTEREGGRVGVWKSPLSY